VENHEYVHAVQYASVTESDYDMQATTIVKKASCGRPAINNSKDSSTHCVSTLPYERGCIIQMSNYGHTHGREAFNSMPQALAAACQFFGGQERWQLQTQDQ
jgi:hypothetical protein